MPAVKKAAPTNIEHYLADLVAVVNEAPDIVIIISATGKILWANKTCNDKLGKVQPDILLPDFLVEHQAEAGHVKEIKRALKEGRDYTGTLLLFNKKQASTWHETKVKAVKDNRGTVTRFILIAHDITEQIRKNKELLYNELRWKFALEASGDGFFEYDLETHKFYGSENLQTLVAVGKDLSLVNYTALINIIHPDDTEGAVNDLFDLLEGQTDLFKREVRVKNKAGKYVWMIVRAIVTSRNKTGEPLHIIGTTTDISQLKTVEAELVKARQVAEKASEYKNQFLSTMSHEIRTPLNAIIGMTDLMQLDKKGGELKDKLDVLSFSAGHLLTLVNDVLDLSKIEAGKIDFVNDDFNIDEVTGNIYRAFEIRSRDKGIDFDYTIDKNVPRILSGDALRLTQILNNLVSNAIKFTEKGSIHLHIGLAKKVRGKAALHFSVTDTGIGIAKNKQAEIFKDFVQADGSIARKYGGTGLGLAITKKLVELQGGHILLESKVSKGSKFSFVIAYQVVSQKAPVVTNTAAPVSKTALQGVKVLLAEDIVANQKVATSYLTYWQAHTTCVNNGKEAIKAFKKQPFDILIIDLFMPVLNGYDTIRQLRALPEGKHIPIIALTASLEQNVMAEAKKAGADMCLGKPIETQKLFTAIAGLTGVSSKPAPLIKAAKSKAGKKQQYISLQRLEDAALGSADFVKQMVELLKQEIPQYVGEALQQLKASQHIDFAATVHKLKNSLLMLGLDHLKPTLVQLEENAKAGINLKQLPAGFKKIAAAWQLAEKELNSL